MIGSNFAFLSLEFAIVGCLILKRLKKYFPEFYLDNKWLLICATLGLSVPLMVRGVFDLIRAVGDFDKHVDEN